ncbi:phage integrase [Marinobacterium sedimentorum]|uniref:phage integrase n=1 Tax=Marinobacterium sedimentorum TaxID=2927804 RepID=UPI0020C6DB3F|nr:tyrosine-type recombinase/integrase [Marinobacterium sedimentorum]MCP8686066.1 tyrosine-type recombinase/integrase [Marinobacterium sedimentorum]
MGIKRTATGRWRVDVELSRGNRLRRTFDNKVDARQFQLAVLNKRQVKDSDWLPKRADKRRLLELVQLWFDMHGHTLRDGERRFRALQRLAARLGDPIAKGIDASRYARDRRQRSAAGISDKTLNNELSYVRAVFNELRSLGEVTYPNPLANIKPIRLQEHELSWLTKEQIDELLTAVSNRGAGANPHLEMIVLVCLATGARWSEAERLGSSSVRNGAVTFSNTKSGKVRTVPIDQALIDRLLDHWRLVGPFTSSIGAFRRAIAKTSIQLPKGQASHVLRHTFASHFMMNGGNILTLQRILGHSSVKVTMRYAHLAPEHLQDAVKLNPVYSLFKC